MFESAKLKLQRAKHHINDLQSTFDAFVQGHRYFFVFGGDPKTGKHTLELRFDEQIPRTFGLILADAIQNLRSTLDFAVWELIGLDGGTQDRWTTLPTGDRQTSYEASCKGIKTPRDDTKKFFIDLACYKGGAGGEIYNLHLLNNAEKHSIITPLVTVGKIPLLKIVRPDGRVAMTLKDGAFSLRPDGVALIAALGAGFGPEIDEEAKPTAEIVFRDFPPFQLKPILPTLMHLADAVGDCLGQFDLFVATRT
jgi:hypothetical protein